MAAAGHFAAAAPSRARSAPGAAVGCASMSDSPGVTNKAEAGATAASNKPRQQLMIPAEQRPLAALVIAAVYDEREQRPRLRPAPSAYPPACHIASMERSMRRRRPRRGRAVRVWQLKQNDAKSALSGRISNPVERAPDAPPRLAREAGFSRTRCRHTLRPRSFRFACVLAAYRRAYRPSIEALNFDLDVRRRYRH